MFRADLLATVRACGFSPDGHRIWAADDGGSSRRPNAHFFDIIQPPLTAKPMTY